MGKTETSLREKSRFNLDSAVEQDTLLQEDMRRECNGHRTSGVAKGERLRRAHGKDAG